MTHDEKIQETLDAARVIAICLTETNLCKFTPEINNARRVLVDNLMCGVCCASGDPRIPAAVCGGQEAHGPIIDE